MDGGAHRKRCFDDAAAGRPRGLAGGENRQLSEIFRKVGAPSCPGGQLLEKWPVRVGADRDHRQLEAAALDRVAEPRGIRRRRATIGDEQNMPTRHVCTAQPVGRL